MEQTLLEIEQETEERLFAIQRILEQHAACENKATIKQELRNVKENVSLLRLEMREYKGDDLAKHKKIVEEYIQQIRILERNIEDKLSADSKPIEELTAEEIIQRAMKIQQQSLEVCR
mmetsp:Transcript_5564/g.7787  ORF Transcript_5564/g.7787 Transcript_5564/m.7787 type:complete len:118 (-) Transcript_5564:61-414(-)